MLFTEKDLEQFIKPLSDTEDQKCLNALTVVSNALRNAGYIVDDRDLTSYFITVKASLQSKSITLLVQGSYANDTNVRLDSDVDLAVISEDVFYTKYRLGVTDADYGYILGGPFSIKDNIYQALKTYITGTVIRGNKSIKVSGNTYRTVIDVVPSYRYKDYSNDYLNDTNNYIKGIRIVADDGTIVINYPEQHISNGRKKNTTTNDYFKKMVRIIKNIKSKMEENHVSSASNMSSFGLESLLWNIPDNVFNKYSTLRYEFGEIVDYLYTNKLLLYSYREANGIKALCPDYQTAGKYDQFISDLKSFYKYDI